ncbi:hypothetical protein LLE60_20520 [Xanthomonas campestris]|uniref:hypothetical protein n=1 Tax=Xanthomonas campestris TaxID=339 RepID=UPI001E396342|nr:hypothetical protein [Xanthomonas campestris]MCC5091005.1 hypothetical protein [Xanthomonas campestris]
MHLIYGNSEDYHAVAVAWAMRKLGAEVFIWDGLGATEDAQISLERVMNFEIERLHFQASGS